MAMRAQIDLLNSAVAIVVTLLTAFGGFLLNIVPDFWYLPWGHKFAPGLAGVFSVPVALLLGSFASHMKPLVVRSVGVLCLLLCLAGFVMYVSVFNQFGFRYPPDGGDQTVLLAGREPTDSAAAYSARTSTTNPARLLLAFGGEQDHVWTETSLRAVSLCVLSLYVATVVTLTAAVLLLSGAAARATGARSAEQDGGDGSAMKTRDASSYEAT